MRHRDALGGFLNRMGLVGEGVEVGVQSGGFARTILNNWHGRVLHLVDAWRHLPNYQDSANVSDDEHEENLSKTKEALSSHVGRYQIHRCLSLEAARHFADHSLDFVYLDANHAREAVEADLAAWFPKVAYGGVLCGHDFCDGQFGPTKFGVRSAVEAFAQEYRLTIHPMDCGSWYLFAPLPRVTTEFIRELSEVESAVNMTAVTIGVGAWRQSAELAAARAAEHTGLNCVVLGDDVWERYSDRYDNPAYLKLHLFDLVDAENLLYFDADAIHLNPWNPRSLANQPAFAAVHDEFVSTIPHAAREAGVPLCEYFNAGVFVANRTHHKAMFERAQALYYTDRPKTLRDQALFNMSRDELGIPMFDLGLHYNHLRFYDDPRFDEQRTIIAHYTPHADDPSEVEAYLRTSIVVNRRTCVDAAQKFISSIPLNYEDYRGRGIVTCAGGIKYQTCAWVLIKMLRHFGCDLPIEVWYLGEQEHDPAWEALVAPLGVTCVDAFAVRSTHPHRRLRGWESKAYAIQHSRFAEVLFLDADNVPVRDPSYLFDDPAYLENGAVFWPDQAMFTTSPESERWRVFGIEYRPELDQESGQLLIDKRRCWEALSLCNWFNEYSDFFYRFVYGDKDTFRFAWHRLGQRFHYIARPAEHHLHGTLSQYDTSGELLFQHRHGAKWSLWRNVHIEGFQFESECLAYLNELREKWNPVERLSGSISCDDRSLVQAHLGARFRCYVRGRRQGRLTLSEQRKVLRTADQADEYWWFKERALVIACNDGRLLYRLRQHRDGGWTTDDDDEKPAALRLVPA